MKQFHLSVAVGKRQQPRNNTYAHIQEISSLEEFRQAVQWDHCGAIFKNNHRRDENFICSDVIMMDCDNSESDNPQDWVTPENFTEKLHDVQFIITYSRNHMKDKYKKDKDGKNVLTSTARPRFHVYLPLSDTCTDAKAIRALKEKFLRIFPDFDAGAKDAARMFYGVETPHCDLREGHVCINEFLATIPNETEDSKQNSESIQHENNDSEIIKEGVRNDTLFHVAMKALKDNGIGETARKIFDSACARCQPPLQISEVMNIWKSATRYAQDFKDRYTPKKSTLTLPVIEKTLQKFKIEMRFDVITHRLSISDLPADNPYMPESYSDVNGFTRKEANKSVLPLFLASYLRDKNFAFTQRFLDDALNAIALTHSYNPFLSMLKNTKWDGQNRIYELCKAMGITSMNVKYVSFCEKWLWQVVSMALNDDGTNGHSFVLVLQGRQGIGKTSIFKKLAISPEWFKEGASIDMNNKDTIIEATSVLICELGELESTLKREQDSLKNFITRNFDEYRPPYGKQSIQYPRRTALCGTVNSEQFLRDATGNRRYVVIPVSEIDKDFVFHVMTPEYCAQLWRQVYEKYYLERGKNGFYLTDEESVFSEAQNAQHTVLKDGEIQIYDLLDWSQHVDAWKWYTNSELIATLELKNFSAMKMGTALNAVMLKDKRVCKKHNKKSNVYFLPPKRKLYS